MDGAINEQTDERPREWRLFFSLDDDGDGFVTRVDLRAALDASGLSRSDLRLGELHAALDELEREDLDLETFLSVIGPAGIVVERALQGALAIPDFY